MDVSQIISSYGYWAVAAGCLLEGETVLLLAGFAAHRGYLSFAGVLGTAALAGFLGDLFFFFMGRRHGPALLARWPSLAKRQNTVDGWIARYRAAVILGVRFTYGFRVAGPVLIGMSSTPVATFVLFNAAGACLWAGLIAGLGWFFGEAAQRMLGHIHHMEKWLALSLLLLSLGCAAYGWWRRRR
ncbi:DedA family protein [Ottowia sp. VDI28]|uniref:DedA family protein n=1 Tax=Ottowia sp. VDI28 TaxID=3133968 RepID=UPI003C302A3A